MTMTLWYDPDHSSAVGHHYDVCIVGIPNAGTDQCRLCLLAVACTISSLLGVKHLTFPVAMSAFSDAGDMCMARST